MITPQSDATSRLLGGYEARLSSPMIDSGSAELARAALREEYLRTAAVLDAFAPESLRAYPGTATVESARSVLFDDIVRTSGGYGDSLYALRLDARREALRSLRSREAMLRALEANPARPRTSLQKMWEGYVRNGSLPDSGRLKYAELRDLSQICTWLQGIDPDVPNSAEVLALMRKRSVYSAFEHLVDDAFTGREEDLAALRAHVALEPPGSGLERLARQLADWITPNRRPVLALRGPGGIGKSALIAKLLSEQLQAEEETRIPFAYLAFDQPTLRIQTPFTILVEAAGQFELQFPEHEGAIEDFRASVRGYRDSRGRIVDHAEPSRKRGARIATVHSIELDLYEAFAELLTVLGGRKHGRHHVSAPVLLVLDTFEEVQYRDRESLSSLWTMLEAIQQRYMPFRVIVSGRGSIAASGVREDQLIERELSELQEKDRVLLLERLGVTGKDASAAIAAQVGGNPLSLRLAARVAVRTPAEVGKIGLSGLETRKMLFFRVKEELIQGQLYRRLLEHIHEPAVRDLAHPGMVLRRLTPELILHVLSPAGVTRVATLEEAEELFHKLREEQALVSVDSDGGLRYRPEIRASMIKLLEQDRLQDVRRLHHAAIDWYSRDESVEGRAEELYHRLALGEDGEWQLDQRWDAEAGSSLASNLEEYPDNMKVWLASRMSLELPRDVFTSASVTLWERNITRKVRQALSRLWLEEALSLLHERSERSPSSPLFALEAKVYLLRGDPSAAEKVIAAGIERVATSTNSGRLAELFWLRAQSLLIQQRALEADEALAEAERGLVHASNPLPLVQVLGHRALLRQVYPNHYPEPLNHVRPRLDEACRRLYAEHAFESAYVVGLALAMLEQEFPATSLRLRKLLRGGEFAFSPETLTDENLLGLEEYAEPWEREVIAEVSPDAAA